MPNHVVRFGQFEVDLSNQDVRKSGRKIKLSGKPFQLLQLLLERPGELVTRVELRDTLWPPDTFVDFDQSLNAAVKTIRGALGDSATNPRFVETIPRRGYRFIAPIATEEEAHEPPPERRSKLFVGAGALAGTILVALGYHLASPDRETPAATPLGGRAMLAVLPFDNLSPDPEQEYFTDGLTEEMISRLARLDPERLGVIARTSIMLYKNSELSLGRIAEELDADYVLEGSVRRAGDDVRITAQLIQSSDQTHLWAEDYQRELQDVFAIQSEVAGRIASSLAIELLPKHRVSFRRKPTEELGAYEAYLKGRQHWSQRTKGGFLKAIDYFQAAIDADPSYAMPYAGLADSYFLLGFEGMMAPEDVFPRARAAAESALEIDEELASAHASLGSTLWAFEWDFESAEASFRRAIELDPGDALVHHWYVPYLAAVGRLDESVAQAKQAQRLDPLSSNTSNLLAAVLFYAGDTDGAIEEIKRNLELHPAHGRSHLSLATFYGSKKMYPRALDHISRAEDLLGAERDADTAYYHALSGNREGAGRYLSTATSPGSTESSLSIALVHSALGEGETALDWLERAEKEKVGQLPWLLASPRFDPLRDEPRFEQLLERIGVR